MKDSKIARFNLQTVFVMLFMAAFLLSMSDDALAAKKKGKGRSKSKKVRVYSKSKTKAEAIEVLKTSEAVAELAGLEPTAENKPSEAYSDVELLKSYVDVNNSEEIGEHGEDLAELEAEDDVIVDLENFRSIWMLAIGGGSEQISKTAAGTVKEELMSNIMNWLGTPYRFGGMSTVGIDCSAWVREVFYQTDSITLPRTAREQINVGRKVKREKLEFGDLVFFHTYSRKFASHVGIYLGDDLFAHASSRKGVTISSLNSTFYNKRFITGKRLSDNDLAYLKLAAYKKPNKDY